LCQPSAPSAGNAADTAGAEEEEEEEEKGVCIESLFFTIFLCALEGLWFMSKFEKDMAAVAIPKPTDYLRFLRLRRTRGTNK